MLDRFPEDDECEQRAYAREWSRNARRRASAPRVEELEAPQPPFEISYRASRWERAWLQHSLQPFFDQGYLADVVSQVRGGKEANVYCCYGAPGVGMPLVAAKVYRPRMFRNLRNDRMYRE
ncbi:MAG: hypothetical protein FJX77_07600, partial [Armatimonadetes bacterium]|nr:hypothetical protein [Armatimonadota bacterium]